jgi:hypothetical protein
MSVEKRKAAGRRWRERCGDERQLSRVGQAEISLYFAGLLLFLFLIAFSLGADHEIAAFAVAFQTGTALLFSPDVLRPLRRLRYFRRPLTKIRAKRRRVLRWVAFVFAVLVALLGVRALKVGGTGSNTTLLGAIVVLLALISGFTALCLVVIWVIDMLFEGAAETWTQTVVSQFGSERTDEVRRVFAVAFFLVGTLLMFWGAYA